MPKLVFDIETVGINFDTLDDTSKGYLLKFAETEDQADAVRQGLGFSPLTGEIVAIGILNPDTNKGAVYFVDKSGAIERLVDSDMTYLPYENEKGMLKEFWDVATHYDRFITFNGRAFDCPYLMIRSAATKVRPSKNLMPNRYADMHIDLADRLSFFGAVRQKASLHMWCRALDIKSPKEDGISGKDVAKMFLDGKYLEIAKYCGGDLSATKKLYEYWEKYIDIK